MFLAPPPAMHNLFSILNPRESSRASGNIIITITIIIIIIIIPILPIGSYYFLLVQLAAIQR